MITETTVLVVGAGPTGLMASELLSLLGIDHIVIEKRTEVQRAPAAHVVNRRTLEIMRQCGMDMAKFYALDKHGDSELRIRWGATLRSPTLGETSVGGNSFAPSRDATLSNETLSNISQFEIEEFLLNEVSKAQKNPPRYGHVWKQFPDENDSNLSEIIDSDGKKYRVRSQYLLAADGSGSAIREALGIQMIGPVGVASLLSLSCSVDRSNVEDGPNPLLDWCLSPELAGVTIAHDPKKLTVYMRPIHMPYETIDDYDDERCEQILSELFGPNVPFTLFHKGVWHMTAQIADCFRVGSRFLIGDAAHRFPPTGGLGLNSGVADAHNVVWKIFAHMNGSTESLLDSYELERRAVVQRNCDVSLANHFKMDEVVAALGLDVTKAAIPAKILASWPIRALPAGVRKSLFSLITWPARRLLARAEENSPRGLLIRESMAKAIENQREHFMCPGLELGYVYRGGCAVSEKSETSVDSSVSVYHPSNQTGGRFPHIELVGEKTSILDYLVYGEYTLIHNGCTVDALQLNTFGLPLTILDIQSLKAADSQLDIEKFLNLNENEWTLVRPDGHVADRS